MPTKTVGDQLTDMRAENPGKSHNQAQPPNSLKNM